MQGSYLSFIKRNNYSAIRKLRLFNDYDFNLGHERRDIVVNYGTRRKISHKHICAKRTSFFRVNGPLQKLHSAV